MIELADNLLSSNIQQANWLAALSVRQSVWLGLESAWLDPAVLDGFLA